MLDEFSLYDKPNLIMLDLANNMLDWQPSVYDFCGGVLCVCVCLCVNILNGFCCCSKQSNVCGELYVVLDCGGPCLQFCIGKLLLTFLAPCWLRLIPHSSLPDYASTTIYANLRGSRSRTWIYMAHLLNLTRDSFDKNINVITRHATYKITFLIVHTPCKKSDNVCEVK